jgi:hypothetical protein
MVSHLGPGAQAQAQRLEPVDGQAYARFLVGVDAYTQELYRLAAVAFDEAYARQADPALVFNAGLAYDLAGDSAVARSRFTRFVRFATADPASTVIANRRLAALPVAERSMLDQEVLLPLLRQLRERLRRLPAPDEDAPRALSYLSVNGTLTDTTPAATSGDPPPTVQVIGWVSLGVGALVAIAGIVLKVDALGIVSDLETVDRRPDGVIASPTQKQAHVWASQASRQDNSATIALATGGGLVAVGVALLVIDMTVFKGERGPPSARWAPGVAPRRDGATVSIGGTFP